ncbi:MAG: hypothetical protein ACPL1K_00995 [Candidatus Kryptoniota bacterium]
MVYVNRVNLEGFLEISKVEVVSLDGKAIPVMHGILHDESGVHSHRIIMSDYPAAITLDMMREFQEIQNGQVLIELGNNEAMVSIRDGMPLVAIEGKLITTPDHNTVIDVKWIFFLTVPPQQWNLADKRLDSILKNIVNSWWSMTETDRQLVYEYLRGFDGRHGKRRLASD